MAVLISHKETLLSLNDIITITDYLNDKSIFNCEELCQLAFEKLQINYEHTNALRNYHKFKTLEEFQKRNVHRIFADLKRKTKFTQPELEEHFSEFKKLVSIGSTELSLSKDSFILLWKSSIAWWPEFIDFEKLFKLFDRNQNNSLSFTEYIWGLEIIIHGSKLQHQQFVFELFSEEGMMFPENITIAINFTETLKKNRNSDNSFIFIEEDKKLLESNTIKTPIDFPTFRSIVSGHPANEETVSVNTNFK